MLSSGAGGGLSGKSRGERHAGFALMENEHGPCALADDERWERLVYDDWRSR
jgi:hypothetical protein